MFCMFRGTCEQVNSLHKGVPPLRPVTNTPKSDAMPCWCAQQNGGGVSNTTREELEAILRYDTLAVTGAANVDLKSSEGTPV